MEPLRLLALVTPVTTLPSWLGFALPVCPLRAITGIACPACGGTRAVVALARGDVAGALAWNPFVILALAALLGAGLAALIAPAAVAGRLAGPAPWRAPGGGDG